MSARQYQSAHLAIAATHVVTTSLALNLAKKKTGTLADAGFSDHANQDQKR
jgi:hypothetical protein